jgi:hypothetical protein
MNSISQITTFGNNQIPELIGSERKIQPTRSFPRLSLGIINSQVGQVLILSSLLENITNNQMLEPLISPEALKKTRKEIDSLLTNIFSSEIFYTTLPEHIHKIPELVSLDLKSGQTRRILDQEQQRYAAGMVLPRGFLESDRGLAFKYFFTHNGKDKITGIRDMRGSYQIPTELSLISATNMLVAHAIDTHLSPIHPNGSPRSLGGNFFGGGGMIDALVVFASFSENPFYSDETFQMKVNDLASILSLGIEEHIQYHF